MAILLITFDLTHDDMDYSGFFERIEEYPHTRLSTLSYLIQTNLSPKNVYDELRGFIQSKDRLFVFTLKPPWHGHGQNEVIDWVSQKF